MKKKILLFVFGIIAIGTVLWQSYLAIPIKASAPSGYAATQGSSSQVTLIEGQVAQVFATSTCVSRIISLGGFKNIWVMFKDSETLPSVNVGNLHSASTTVAYDAGIYGCGLWRIYNASATTSIFTITEFSGFK